MATRSASSRAPRRSAGFRAYLQPSSLGDAELLLLLLGKKRRQDGLEHAQQLLGFGGGVEGLARMSATLLAQQKGLGPARALRLVAAFELGARRFRSTLPRSRIDSLKSVVDWAQPRLLPLDHEEMWLLSLDGRNGLTGCRCVGQGGLHGLALTAKDILRPALRDGASSIVLVHNHPSGDPTPSAEDIHMTEATVYACNAIGLPLLDHVIVAREGASSLLALGIVPAR